MRKKELEKENKESKRTIARLSMNLTCIKGHIRHNLQSKTKEKEMSEERAISIISGARGCSWNCAKIYYESRKKRNKPLISEREAECYKNKYRKTESWKNMILAS